MKYLVVGGAGYIGSYMAKLLAKRGNEIVILDNLSTGFRESAIYGDLIVGDLSDESAIDQIFLTHKIDAVLHFAACSQVAESSINPSKYYRNNVSNTLNLLDAMVRHKVMKIIFSSTAAIFGEPQYTPINESHPKNPINPYGASKLMIERILQDYADSYGVQSVILRYFNAAGADPECELGERHDPETHLIPLMLQAATGRRESITVFGRDYPTEDGTCIRDYIHVHDLCEAHASALHFMNLNPNIGSYAFNLGNGNGFSVQEVLSVALDVVSKEGLSIAVLKGERRDGDPSVLIADASLAKEELNWRPEYSQLSDIVSHAWEWEKHLALNN